MNTWLKHFADSAGKKAGEFYTPNEIVKLLVKHFEPDKMPKYTNPTVGSGGMLIECKTMWKADTERQKIFRYTDRRKANGMGLVQNEHVCSTIFTTARFWTVIPCWIRYTWNGNELRTFDIILANPPFSQDYSTTSMKFKERFSFDAHQRQSRFHVCAAHGGFAQQCRTHGSGNAARCVVSGGEEKKFREWLVNRGYLEAVIGAFALFYGTGIGAAWWLTKPMHTTETMCLFINADREFKRRQNQNKLRPEDLEKLPIPTDNKKETPKYSKLVAKSKAIDEHNNLENEDFNFNIRRFVDNAPPEPQDVHAHLQGGIPENEVKALNDYFNCYAGLKPNYLSH